MVQLYDKEEIIRVREIGIARDSATRTVVEMCQEFGMTFIDTMEKIASKFTLSQKAAEEEVREYWSE